MKRQIKNKLTFLQQPSWIASILVVAWAFFLSAYAFNWPEAGCTPENCPMPLTQDLENQRVGIATDSPKVTLDVNGGMRIWQLTTGNILSITCNANKLGTLIFDTDANVVKVCKSAGWSIFKTDCDSTTKNINGHIYNIPAIEYEQTSTVTSVVYSISNGQATSDQSFFCNDGRIEATGWESQSITQCNSWYYNSGSACSVSSCNLPWGGSINTGQSVTAYASSSVACGSSCTAQTRTCTNWVLDGSYTNQSCSVWYCPTSWPYSYWDWWACSVSCGWGIQYRTQYCNYDSCYSPQSTSQSCNTQSCCVVNAGSACVLRYNVQCNYTCWVWSWPSGCTGTLLSSHACYDYFNNVTNTNVCTKSAGLCDYGSLQSILSANGQINTPVYWTVQCNGSCQ